MISTILAWIIAITVPFGFFGVVRSLDFYKTGSQKFTLLSFLAGLGAFGLAFGINRGLLTVGMIQNDLLVRFYAPWIEEILKSLLLIYLVRQARFTYFVDGLIFGFASGIGFAAIENCSYLVTASTAAMSVALGRVLSTNLIHAAGSSLVGLALGLARFERRRARRILTLAVGDAAAILLHTGFNNLVSSLAGLPLTLAAIGLGFGAAGVIAVFVRRGLKEATQWIREKLGEADRITSAETSAVLQMEKIDDFLEDHFERTFGQEKAVLMKDVLLLQAQLGIQMKSRQRLSDERMQAGVDQQIGAITRKMDQLRSAIGPYGMSFVRFTFATVSINTWDNLAQKIVSQAASAQQTSLPTLWDRIDARAPQAPQAAQAAKTPFNLPKKGS